MSTRAPRRRPGPSRRHRPRRVPFWVLIALVIAAGLGIGAIISAMGAPKRDAMGGDSNPSAIAGLPVTTPPPAPMATGIAEPPGSGSTHPPRRLRTPEPQRTPKSAAAVSPAPSISPSPLPSEAPTPTPVATSRVAATLTPAHAPVVVRKPHPVRTIAAVTPAPTPSEAPVPVVVPTRRAKPAVRPSAVRVAVAAPLVPQADGPFARTAAGVVRTYLEAIVRGDDQTAYSQLDGAPGDPSHTLSEKHFIDPQSRITGLRSHQTGDGSATVEADIAGGRGRYVATYEVAQNDRGTFIRTHDYTQP